MASDPTEAVMNSVGDTLAANAGVIAAFGGSSNVLIYQIAPPIGQAGGDRYPYMTLNDSGIVDLENKCSRDIEYYFDIHVWTQSDSFTQCRALAAAVREALYRNVSVTGWRVIIADHERTRYMPDVDVTVQHAVLSFRLEMQPE
jgi:hypothetical protein